jgi:hypothetical protein
MQLQVKGSLNRLAESNLHVIARQMEDLYMSNSRNLMNECLCQILTTSQLKKFSCLKIIRLFYLDNLHYML